MTLEIDKNRSVTFCPNTQDKTVSDATQALAASKESSQVVVFDFGGVVGATRKKFIVQFFEKELNLSKKEAKSLVHDIKKWERPIQEFWVDYAKKAPAPLPQNWVERYKQAGIHTTVTNPEVVKIVQEVHAQGHKTAILSNVTHSRAARFRRLGVYRDYDYVVLSCEIGVKKPDARAYEIFLKQANVLARQCLLIDDKEKNVAAGKRAGLDGIIFTSAQDLRAELIKRHILKLCTG
jgi:putative hydrolase of the HAD superfamily